jgi:ParB-like nuclease domain
MPTPDTAPQIAPALAHLAIPIDLVQPHAANARQGDIGAIGESLRRFGQLKPIVVQRATMTIVAGNHLYLAARAAGWAHIAAAVADLSEADARAFMVADNRTQELGSYDTEALGLLLAALAESGNLAGTGYDGDDVDALLADLERDQQRAGPSAFLDGFLGAPAPPGGAADDDDEGTPLGTSRQATLPADGYVQLVFVVTPAQRLQVYAALQHALAAGQFDKQADALVLLADEYLRTRPD